jgi:drug/metabolite transporter (DMT)-like permease
MTSSANRRGIINLSIGMSFFIGNDALAKLASESLPGAQVIFIRGLFASLLMIVVCAALGALRRQAASGELPIRQLLNPRLLLRASLDAIGTVVYLTALFHMPLGNATAINMATPLFITVMAVFAFKERVGLARWLAISAGFAGVLLIVQPTAAGYTDSNSAWALLALAGTVLLSVRDLMTRVIPSRISSLLVTLSAMLAVPLLAGVVVAFQGWQPVTLRQLALLACAGALLSCGFFLLVRALRVGEMSVVSPFRYTGLLYALLLGWLVWGDVPNPLAFTGIGLLAAAGLFMVRHARVPSPARAPQAAMD